jgi:hypothetical protein
MKIQFDSMSQETAQRVNPSSAIVVAQHHREAVTYRYTYAMVRELMTQVGCELGLAIEKHPAPYNSAHEAFAVMAEEFDEFKAEVWKKAELRDQGAMKEELLQIAATALRAIHDLGLIEYHPEDPA